jgi:hypothetical protein
MEIGQREVRCRLKKSMRNEREVCGRRCLLHVQTRVSCIGCVKKPRTKSIYLTSGGPWY